MKTVMYRKAKLDKKIPWEQIEGIVHFGWNFDAVKDYFKDNLKVGDLVVSVMQTRSGPMGDLTRYEFIEVESINKSRFKLAHKTGHNYTSKSFYYSGKSCNEPNGQTRVIPFDDKYLELLK
tara:strand:+ start:546 stop:908 length:363 start_codon:yes stop_codon:yes gene_type:complete